MKFISIYATPAHSLILVEDILGGNPPSSLSSTVASTDSCVAVVCKPETDGLTHIKLSHNYNLNMLDAPAFNDLLQIPSRRLAVHTIDGKSLLETTVSSNVIRLRVWTNDASEPDEITLGIEDIF